MDNIPHVNLLVTQAQQTYALAVSDILLTRFGISSVTVRFSHTPADRLLVASEYGGPMLYVVLGPSTSSTSVLESDSAAPIITLTTTVDAPSTALSIARCCGLASPDLRERVNVVVQNNRQARLVQDAQLRTSSSMYISSIAACFDQKMQVSGVCAPEHRGKVRDRFDLGSNQVALVTTDRQSGFDRMLAMVPFKGAVLNLTSAFWFGATKHIIPNHLVDVPHPYVSICRRCKPFPIEFVVRSYMTGSTSTSIWKNYQGGCRNYCGHDLPEGMKKNQKLAKNLLTPTTKEEDHDRPISVADIVTEEWMTQEDLDVCAKAALEVFAFGQETAAEHGLILVDTKYEFGRDLETGKILLIDEVHTPDSSRYWLASTYQQKVAQNEEPDNIDKEFLRLWFRNNCDPYKDETLPEAPRELVLELARRYVCLYEMISWRDFDFGIVQQLQNLPALLKELTSTTEALPAIMSMPNPLSLIPGEQKEFPKVEQLGSISLEQLHKYHCNNPTRRCLSLFGDIFDVTSGESSYGPDGGYKEYAGHDVTLALGAHVTSDAWVDKFVQLDKETKEGAEQWKEFFASKYPMCGRLDKWDEDTSSWPLLTEEEKEQMKKGCVIM